MPSKRELKLYADHYGVPWDVFSRALDAFRARFGPKGLSKLILVSGQAKAAGVDVDRAWDDALAPDAAPEIAAD